MRILGFATDWPKLAQPRFTTFRFERRDRDWFNGEVVQIRVKHRSKGGGIIKGTAIIETKERKDGQYFITDAEAKEDGFASKVEMWRWLLKAHTPEQMVRPLNKLTLVWIKRNVLSLSG